MRKPYNYSFLLPIIAFIPWYGMLITMLICWAAQGHPIYWFMHQEQFPVYISDIGATNLRPLFISCAGWQGLGYFLTVICDLWQRGAFANRFKCGSFKLQPFFSKHEPRLIFSAAIIGGLGEIGLLMCSIFSTALYPHVHISMVSVFVVLMFISVCCYSAAYFIMGKHYALLHPLANLNNYDNAMTNFNDLKLSEWRGHIWNKFTISATAKMIWLTCALIWAICFGALDDDSKSSCFEWLLAFWFGILFIIISIDFYLGSRFKHSKFFNNIPMDYLTKYKYYKIFFDREINGMDLESLEKISNNFDNSSTSESVLNNDQLSQ